MAIVALYQGREAERQRDIAASRELAARATSFLDVDPGLSLALALRALERRDTEQAENVLRQATLASRALSVWPAHDDWVHVVEPSRDGRQVVTAGRDGAVRIWNLDRGRARGRFKAHRGWALGASLSPDGRQVASAGDDGVVAIWDVDEQARSASCCASAKDYATGVEFSPDGRRLIVPRARRHGACRPRQRRRARDGAARARGGGLGGAVQPGRHAGGQRRRRWHRADLGSRERRVDRAPAPGRS